MEFNFDNIKAFNEMENNIKVCANDMIDNIETENETEKCVKKILIRFINSTYFESIYDEINDEMISESIKTCNEKLNDRILDIYILYMYNLVLHNDKYNNEIDLFKYIKHCIMNFVDTKRINIYDNLIEKICSLVNQNYILPLSELNSIKWLTDEDREFLTTLINQFDEYQCKCITNEVLMCICEQENMNNFMQEVQTYFNSQ